MLNFTRLTGLEYDGYAGPRALADKVVVKTSYCEKCRDRCFLGADLAVRKNQNVNSVTDGGIGIFEELFKGGFEAFS